MYSSTTSSWQVEDDNDVTGCWWQDFDEFFWAFLNGLLAIEKCPELIITEVDIEGN